MAKNLFGQRAGFVLRSWCRVKALRHLWALWFWWILCYLAEVFWCSVLHPSFDVLEFSVDCFSSLLCSRVWRGEPSFHARLMIFETNSDAACIPDYVDKMEECPHRSAGKAWIQICTIVLQTIYTVECGLRVYVEREKYVPWPQTLLGVDRCCTFTAHYFWSLQPTGLLVQPVFCHQQIQGIIFTSPHESLIRFDNSLDMWTIPIAASR